MNLFDKVSSIMTDYHQLVTLDPTDNLLKVKEIFETHKFHHIPVVHFREIVGLVSQTDFLRFAGGISTALNGAEDISEQLASANVSEIMVTKLGKIEPDTRINVVLEVFLINRIHALPVIQDGELVGMVTPFDILKSLASEKLADPTDAY